MLLLNVTTSIFPWSQPKTTPFSFFDIFLFHLISIYLSLIKKEGFISQSLYFLLFLWNLTGILKEPNCFPIDLNLIKASNSLFFLSWISVQIEFNSGLILETIGFVILIVFNFLIIFSLFGLILLTQMSLRLFSVAEDIIPKTWVRQHFLALADRGESKSVNLDSKWTVLSHLGQSSLSFFISKTSGVSHK